MISRRRLLAGAITGVTLLMVPREVLSPARPAAATADRNPVPSAPGTTSASSASPPPAAPSPAVVPVQATVTVPAAPPITSGASYPVIVESLSYAGQTGTVFRPQVAAAHPVIYFLHGGFWEYGTRHQYDGEARRWAQRGWVAVTLDYSVGVGFRDQVDDILTGVAATGQHGYADAGRQILFGDSAGGHLAALVAAENPGRFRGQILWSPVISPLNAYQDGLNAVSARKRLSQSAQHVAGADWLDADPSRKVTATTPPLWIAGSTREFVDFARQGQLLADAMGPRAEVHLMPGDLHGKSLEQGALLRSARAWARARVI